MLLLKQQKTLTRPFPVSLMFVVVKVLRREKTLAQGSTGSGQSWPGSGSTCKVSWVSASVTYFRYTHRYIYLIGTVDGTDGHQHLFGNSRSEECSTKKNFHGQASMHSFHIIIQIRKSNNDQSIHNA